MIKQPKPPRGPRNLKAGGFTNGLWRLEEHKRNSLLTKLRRDRDAAAARGDHAEALILNDRIKDLKEAVEECAKWLEEMPEHWRTLARDMRASLL